MPNARENPNRKRKRRSRRDALIEANGTERRPIAPDSDGRASESLLEREHPGRAWRPPMSMLPRPFRSASHDAHVHLALPLGALGMAGAAYVSDYFRFGFYRTGAEARGTFAVILPLAGALIGLVVSMRAVAMSRLRTYAAAIASTIVAGAVIGAVLHDALWGSSEAMESAGAGAVTGLVFLPFVALVMIAARISGRARPGSLVDLADRRAPWMVIAGVVAAGRLLVCASPPEGLRLDAANRLTSVSSAFALLASIAATLFVFFDVASYARARRAILTIASMAARDPSSSAPCDDTLDVGVGDEEHEELYGGPAYRTVWKPLRVVRGSCPNKAAHILKKALIACPSRARSSRGCSPASPSRRRPPRSPPRSATATDTDRECPRRASRAHVELLHAAPGMLRFHHVENLVLVAVRSLPDGPPRPTEPAPARPHRAALRVGGSLHPRRDSRGARVGRARWRGRSRDRSRGARSGTQDGGEPTSTVRLAPRCGREVVLGAIRDVPAVRVVGRVRTRVAGGGCCGECRGRVNPEPDA